jgi:hypothetical protein
MNSTVASINYYGREKECIAILVNDSKNSLLELQEKWTAIEQFEKSIRYDAKVFTSLILQLPNVWSKDEALQKISYFLSTGKVKEQEYAAFIHKGEQGEVAKNFHCHLIYNERDKRTRKKNRTMSKLGFQKDLVKDFQKTYGQDILEKLENIPKVERIDMALWKANPAQARSVKQELRKIKQQIDEREYRNIDESLTDITRTFSGIRRTKRAEQAATATKSANISRTTKVTDNEPKHDKGFKPHR